MRSNTPRLFANTALVAVLGCAAPPDDLTAGATEEAADAGADTSLDRASPVLLNGGFSVPRNDAPTDVPAPRPEAPVGESGPGRDVVPEASAVIDDARTADARPIDACADGSVRKPPDASIADRSAPAEDAEAEAASVAESAPAPSCGDGALDPGEGCDDGNRDNFDACSNHCRPATDHLIITEVVTRPSGAEMIEIHNPTAVPIDLGDYALADSHLYYAIATGSFSTGSGSDFVAFFPPGSQIAPGRYRTVSIANGSGGLASFEATYGKKPDFELRPTANGASDDAEVPNMLPATGIASIGASASLTDAGEPVVLFRYDGSGGLVSDIDYVYFGAASAANPAVDKTGIVIGSVAYASECAGTLQKPAPAPGDGGALHRCAYGEGDEVSPAGNGASCHDETSEVFAATFVRSANAVDQRTPGGPPPAELCP